jgi:crossover junction endodeoxyribonuclease RuvC
MKLIVGIDPGISGGVAIMDTEGNAKSWYPMPVTNGKKNTIDPVGLSGLLMYKDDVLIADIIKLCVIEDVHAMPKQGVSSMFSFGRSLGIIQGVVATLGIPYQFVTPQKWKKTVLDGFPNKDKNDAATFCNRRWPYADFRASTRSKKPHEGIVEAMCMAEYGRRVLCPNV